MIKTMYHLFMPDIFFLLIHFALKGLPTYLQKTLSKHISLLMLTEHEDLTCTFVDNFCRCKQ